ncbi:MAG TPA: site-specific integrase, partial [Microvirga sp.]|nr:site-specific integrase [Microvirga sp.]
MAWLAAMAKERRLSAKTVEAYGRDLRQFLTFLTSHLGEPPGVEAILGLKPLDIRAFLAARRMNAVQSRSLMRQLAALRSFARHLEREGHGTASAFAAIRTPKVDKNLPRPLSASSAVAVTDAQTRASENRRPWILARDAAVLSLLYGAGLRISEALGVQRRDAPIHGTDAITVTG